MPEELIVLSYAKVNYTLDILSPRPDGFHNLATVLQTVSLSDTIELRRKSTAGIIFHCDAPGVPRDGSNLSYRAAESALRAGNCKEGLDITVVKRIPSQAGLGGGSSNAAYTLAGVNTLFGLNLRLGTLVELAVELGSDVPFFLSSGTASARGRGEVVTALPDGPPLWFIIVKPDLNVSTRWAFNKLDSFSNRVSARSTRAMEERLGEGDAERITARMTNDFEQAVCAEHLEIALLLDDFHMARARNARLCGSGSAVFGVAYSEPEAEEVARIMRLKYSSVFVCRAVRRDEALTMGTFPE